MNNDDCPKGFRYVQTNEVINKLNILKYLTKRGLQTELELVEFPPVAFLSSFYRCSKTLGDKIYTFKDRKGRNLVLTPDSLCHSFNYYLSRSNYDHNLLRFTWLSPTFRYRNIKNRHFTQIGFASINYPQENSMFELSLLSRLIAKFIQDDLSIPVNFKIINPKLIQEIISTIFLDDFIATNKFNELRKLPPANFEKWIKNNLPDCPQSSFLSGLLSGNLDSSCPVKHSRFSQEINKLKVYLDCLNYDNSINCHIDLKNMHSSETLSGTGFILETQDGVKIGDGGLYDCYGKQYSEKISTVASVCTGIEALLKVIDNRGITPEKNMPNKASFMLIFPLVNDDIVSIAIQLIDVITGLNYSVNFCVFSKSKKTKKALQNANLCCFVNKIEKNNLLSGKVFQPKLEDSRIDFNLCTPSEIGELITKHYMTMIYSNPDIGA